MNKKIIKTGNAPEPIGPYNQAVLANGFLFVSGQIPINPDTGELITGDVKTEAELVMQNIKGILDKAGLDFSSVVKASIFLKNMDDFPVVNEVYGAYFDEAAPARECVEVARLPKNVNVEISVIAVL